MRFLWPTHSNDLFLLVPFPLVVLRVFSQSVMFDWSDSKRLAGSTHGRQMLQISPLQYVHDDLVTWLGVHKYCCSLSFGDGPERAAPICDLLPLSRLLDL